ncbi:MAG: hypothetical protein L6R41_004252 [Letrouitia leprolyta]|nr:MAG: hypothetical protein L6R41_004252 [Letrouitia leprolyta]
MSANNSPLKGVKGSKWNNVGVVEDKKPEDPSQRRRSSSGAKFSGLMSQKRNSGDAAAAARKASFAEMNRAPGFLGGLWNKLEPMTFRIMDPEADYVNSFTKGPSNSK